MARRAVHPWRLLWAAAVLLIVGAGGASAGPLGSALGHAIAQSVGFLQTFDGHPPSPQAWQPAQWDVTVHSDNSFTTLPTMQAQHGSDCGSPPATHAISSYGDAVFQCKDHLMTAIYGDGGYAAIYLTPNQMVDFSAGEAVVSFDVSTLRRSTRDWIDLWISPYQDHLQMPLENWLPDLQGVPRRAVHVRMDNTVNGTYFRTTIIRDFSAKSDDIDGQEMAYETFLAPSATVRETFELHISRTHVKFGMPQHNFWWTDADIPDLGWSQAVVQLGHHSYNPNKGDCMSGGCGPNTWHWDNVAISPAVPFTILRADRRFVDPSTPSTVNFSSPIPAGASLRFAGLGSGLQFSVDGGRTWQAAKRQAQERDVEEHFASYWTPVPAGATSVQIRGQQWWGGDWRVRDISVWAPNAPSPDSQSGSQGNQSDGLQGGTASATLATSPATPTMPMAPATRLATATRTPLVKASATQTRTATATKTSAVTALLGQTVVQRDMDSNADGTAEAFPFSASASGTVTKLSLYLDGSSEAATVVVGLYSAASANGPGALLTQGAITAPKNGDWNTVTVPAANVTQGTSYWIAVLSPSGSGTMRFRDSAGGSGLRSLTSADDSLSALRAAWSSASGWPTWNLSAYAS